MKVARLIELLQKADPTGQANVAVYQPDDDYFFGIIDMDIRNVGSDSGLNLHIHIGDLENEIEG